jgi:hypothetical protein
VREVVAVECVFSAGEYRKHIRVIFNVIKALLHKVYLFIIIVCFCDSRKSQLGKTIHFSDFRSFSVKMTQIEVKERGRLNNYASEYTIPTRKAALHER